MTRTEAETAARAYERGASIRDLAGSYSVAPSTMRTALIGAGVTLRPRGGPRRHSAPYKVRATGILPTYGYAPETS